MLKNNFFILNRVKIKTFIYIVLKINIKYKLSMYNFENFRYLQSINLKVVLVNLLKFLRFSLYHLVKAA